MQLRALALPHVGVPDGLRVPARLAALAGQQALAQPLQSRLEHDLHVHVTWGAPPILPSNDEPNRQHDEQCMFDQFDALMLML